MKRNEGLNTASRFYPIKLHIVGQPRNTLAIAEGGGNLVEPLMRSQISELLFSSLDVGKEELQLASWTPVRNPSNSSWRSGILTSMSRPTRPTT